MSLIRDFGSEANQILHNSFQELGITVLERAEFDTASIMLGNERFDLTLSHRMEFDFSVSQIDAVLMNGHELAHLVRTPMQNFVSRHIIATNVSHVMGRRLRYPPMPGIELYQCGNRFPLYIRQRSNPETRMLDFIIQFQYGTLSHWPD